MSEEKIKEISWRAAEFNHAEKSPLWQLTVGVVAFALFLFSLLRGNFFFAVFIAIAGLLIVFFGNRRPPVVNFKISGGGIAVSENFYDYDGFEGFAVLEKPGRLDEIVLQRKRHFNPYLKLPIDSKTAASATLILREKLPEIEYEEPLIEVLSEWLGF